MTDAVSRVIAATLASAALAAMTPAASFAAPSRAELEASVVQMENTIAELQRRLNVVEERSGVASGDPGASTMGAVQSELQRVVGELEEARYQNQRLQEELRNLRREIQLRDAEIAERLKLEPAFLDTGDAYADPRAAVPGPAIGRSFGDVVDEPLLDEPGSASEGRPAESDPSFFGADPFAKQKAAAVGTLGAATTARGLAPAAGSAQLPDDPASALQYARQLLTAGRFEEAEAAFTQFQSRFGESPQAGEALYWQAEGHSLRQDYDAARDLYIASLRKDSTGPRAADSMVSLASTLQSLGDSAKACETLTAFSKTYPNAALAVRTKAQRLREQAGCR